MHYVAQFYLRAREKQIHIETYCKYVIKYILWSYVHFRFFASTCISFLPCLVKNQWNVDKDKIYMKMKPKFLEKKGEWCGHQRRIENSVKHIRWLFAKIDNGKIRLKIRLKTDKIIFTISPVFNVWQNSE